MYCIKKGFSSCLGHHFAPVAERIVQGEYCLTSHGFFRSQSLACADQPAFLYAPIYELENSPLADRVFYLVSQALEPIKEALCQMALSKVRIHTILPEENSIRSSCLNPPLLSALYTLIMGEALGKAVTFSFSYQGVPDEVLQDLCAEGAYFVLGAVDSFIEPILFRELQIQYGLMSAQSQEGVAPGEAAAFGLFTSSNNTNPLKFFHCEGQKNITELFCEFMDDNGFSYKEIPFIITSSTNIPHQLTALHELQQEVWLKNLELKHDPQPEFFAHCFPQQYLLSHFFGWLGCAQLPMNMLLLGELMEEQHQTAISINSLDNDMHQITAIRRMTS